MDKHAVMDKQAYDALRNQAAYIELPGRGKIRAVGEDRARLLHAMCTNDVQNLQPGTGCYAFFLSAQGRILADVNLFAMPDYLLLDTEPASGPVLFQHLDKFIIADDVTLQDFTPVTATVTIEGPEAEKVLDALGGMPAHLPFTCVEWGRRAIAHTTYTGNKGWSIFVPEEERESLFAEFRQLGIPKANQPTADTVRLENGKPRFGVDFTDANLPQETQVEGAVHFSKGCYLGQEIVERVRSRGHVNRLLVPLEIETSEAPGRGAKVLLQGNDVGEITSAAFSPALGRVVALGIVRAEAALGGSPLVVDNCSATVAKRQATTLAH